MSDKLFGIRTKIEWTKKHIVNLDATIQSFLGADAYKIRTKNDPKTGKMVNYVTHLADIPAELPHIVGDILSNMVSVLDHLAYRLYIKGTKGLGKPGRHIYFPIFDDATKYIAGRQGKVQGIDPLAIAAIDALEPYKGGKGERLWVLKELNNLSKHRELVAIMVRLGKVDIAPAMINALRKILPNLQPLPGAANNIFVETTELRPLKVGDEILSTMSATLNTSQVSIGFPQAELNKDMNFTIVIAINEPQIIKAEPLVETAHQLLALVDGITNQFIPFL